MRRAKSLGDGTITFSLALGAARQVCRLMTTFQTDKQALSYLHKYRTELEQMARARLASGQLEDGIVVLSMLAVSMIALFGAVISVPLYMQNVLHQPTEIIGLTLLPGGLLMGLLGPSVGRLYDRFGPTPLVVPGAAVVSGVFFSFSFLSTSTPVWLMIVSYLVLCLGLAFLFTPLFTSALGALPPHLYSHGSATLATIQQVAGAAGTALFIALLAIGKSNGLAAGLSTEASIASGVRLAFLVGAIVSLLALALAFFVRKPPAAEIPDPEPAEGNEVAAPAH